MDKRNTLLQHIEPQVINSDADFPGIPIDMQGVHQAKFGLFFGAVSDGDFTFKLEDSDDSVFTSPGDILAEDLIVDDTVYNVAATGAVSSQSIVLSTRNRQHKQFVRLLLTASSSANYLVSASVVLMGLSHTVDQTVVAF
jgi:hypothetical protein